MWFSAFEKKVSRGSQTKRSGRQTGRSSNIQRDAIGRDLTLALPLGKQDTNWRPQVTNREDLVSDTNVDRREQFSQTNINVFGRQL
jgi:hypothetical protein